MNVVCSLSYLEASLGSVDMCVYIRALLEDRKLERGHCVCVEGRIMEERLSNTDSMGWVRE